MELVENTYYNPVKFNNTSYLTMMALEKYFAIEIFKGDASRIHFSSPEFAFRQRINKLFPTISPPYTSVTASQLHFPFASYYRSKEWSIDTRPAIQNATAALVGFEISDAIPVPLRFLQTEKTYTMYFYFDRDSDAQNAYDILMWIQNPTPKQFTQAGLQYKNYKLDIPIIMSLSNVTWTNQYKEKDWLEKNRVIVISAEVNIKSVIVDQYAQGTISNIFDVMPADSDIGKWYITKECILDFLSYKGEDMRLSDENIVLDIIGTFDPDPTLDATLAVSGITETECTVTWNYNSLAEDLYEDNVTIIFDTGVRILVPMLDKSITVPDLNSESTYVISIYFTSLVGQVTKLTTTIETVLPSEQKALKGMIGTTW